MATKPRRKTNGSAAGDNTTDAAKECYRQVCEWLDHIDSEKAKYMKKAKDARIEISGIYAVAKERGVNTKAIKTLVKTVQLERSKQKLIEQLDPEGEQMFGTYAREIAPWDDTPLAQAAQ